MGLEQQPSVMVELSIKNGPAPGVGQGHKMQKKNRLTPEINKEDNSP